MNHLRTSAFAGAITIGLLAAMSALVAAPAAAAPGPPVLLHTGLVTRQDVPNAPGSEPDTVVEPDVAVSPLNSDVAVAAAHDSRFSDGGAVDISSAWTADGGATWHHAPVRGITTVTGGPYERASDPIVAFGSDGWAYLSVLVFNASNCDTGVAVLRSTDGGQHWSAPSYAHRSTTCSVSDDKNFLTVDSGATSPHRGRLYQFWSEFYYSSTGTYLGSPQVVRWSDDHGATWSSTSSVTPRNHATQDSQPSVLADGTVVDTYYDYGASGVRPDALPGFAAEASRATGSSATPNTVDPTGPIFAARSTDGGATWSLAGEATNNGNGYAQNVRCCLFSGTLDPVTQTLYVVWDGWAGGNTDPVYLSSSPDGGLHWTSPVVVSQGDVPGIQRVNAEVSARAGRVYVAYGTRTDPSSNGGFVQQQLSTSLDHGLSFGGPQSIGPVSALQWAARSRGYFPGDYTGSAVTAGRLYEVWAVSSAPPPFSTSPYHQVIEGATLRI